MICYMITIVAKWLLGQSWPLLTKLCTYLKTKFPKLIKRIQKLVDQLNEQLKKFKATIDAIKRIVVRFYIKIKNLISYIISLLNPTKKYSPRANTSLIIGLIGSAAVAMFLTRSSSTGPTKTFLQLTLLLVFLGLYQILVFFQKMYSMSKWTTEAARFTKIIVQAFWVLELGTYLLFTYLMSIRPNLNSYGFAHFLEITTSQLTPIMLLQESLLLALTLLPLLLLKLVKKNIPKEAILVLFALTFHYTVKTFYAEVTQLLLLSTWVETQQIRLLSETITSLNTADTLQLTNAKPLLEHISALESVEKTHEGYTSLFYSLILISLKVLHSGFIVLLLLVVLLQYTKTSDLSYSLVSILTVNAIFLYAFSVASVAPTLADELTLYSSQITAPYEGINRGPSLNFIIKNAANA